MKIKELRLRNYKRFQEEFTLSFEDDYGKIPPVTLLVGENGSGKSTVLQAIAMLLGGGSPANFKPHELSWPGFRYASLQNGRMPLRAEATLLFTEEERNATKRYAEELQEKFPERNYDTPDTSREVRLRLDYENKQVVANSATEYYQIKGYQYAQQLKKFHENYPSLFQNVGTMLFYDEQRTSTSLQSHFDFTEGRTLSVKEVLDKWYTFHTNLEQERFTLREGQRDFYAELDSLYQRIFYGRKLIGSMPQMNPERLLEAPDFLLYDGKNEYDFDEMSAGERAVFPLLVDFANWNVNNSIILIDELELHLHPPAQQALLRALPKLGENNQFIVTTHSDYIALLFYDDHVKSIEI